MQAIGYCRVSTEDQAREGVSLENQKSKIQAYATLKDLELVEVIEDAGISAKNLNRPGIKRVLELAKTGQVQAVIVFKLDRMFRSTVDALETTKLFDKWGVSFHSINETLDTQSPMGRFFFTLTAALAEMERGIVAERTKTAMGYKKAQGQRVGAVPFGYRLTEDGKTLQAIPQEQGAIRAAKALKKVGMSLRKIACELSAQGLIARNGKNFEAMQVKRMLAAA